MASGLAGSICEAGELDGLVIRFVSGVATSEHGSDGQTGGGVSDLRGSELESGAGLGHGMRMSNVNDIESALSQLSLEDLQAVRDWLEDFIEDRLEVSDEFKAKIQRAQHELAGGIHARSRQPESTP